MIIGVGTLLAAVIAVPPVILAVSRLQGFVLSIPWGWLTAVLGTVYAASLLAVLGASRRLRAQAVPTV